MFGCLLTTIACLTTASDTPGVRENAAHTVDIGTSGDEHCVDEGFYGREGPDPKSRIPLVRNHDFRWTGGEFVIRLPVFPERHNEITFHMLFRGGMKLEAGPDYDETLFGSASQTEHTIFIPAEVVGRDRVLTIRGRAIREIVPTGKDPRGLFAMIERVVVRPVNELPPGRPHVDAASAADIPTLDRIRGIERRPANADVAEYVEHLVAENANVVTLGAMYGSGYLFFPCEFGTPHASINPNWLPDVTLALRARHIDRLCWVLFNIQDMQNTEDFAPAKLKPQWQMQFIEDPEHKPGPAAGMCVVSSPYVQWHAKILKAIAAFDIQGFFFDGFYFAGVPDRSRAGCTCDFCKQAFARDTGLELPGEVDWTDAVFKRWVRWRNERILETARYFQSEIRRVNPKATCTFNYNIWPFGGKDWETAIPMWRIDDFGVSQHAYAPSFDRKWLLLGFKSRIGRDMNPRHTDIWRACGYQHTCGKKEPDPAWHELEIKTFILAGLSHGITPWHSTIEGPVECSARIHADVARRERYFSRDHVANVAVLCSQNTHDFFGHLPGTGNLTDYRDGLLGTWMLLAENHIPFEFVFDNQIETAIPNRYRVLILPNTAALSQRATDVIVGWVRSGGHLVATAETGQYDEWGERPSESRLKRALETQNTGRGRVTWFATDPGLAYCRSRDTEPAQRLTTAVREIPMPFSAKAPASLVINMFNSPDHKELWVHLLNVSHLMPDGDSGFRGLDRPPAPGGARIGCPLVPARGIDLTIHDHRIESARLVVANIPLSVGRSGRVVIPSVDLHDVLVLRLKQKER